jgi:prepilin-type N-terminal cleavage/methylation domain-containing protein
MKTPSHRRRGFTLVEVLVASSIMAIIMAVLLRTFLEVLNAYTYDAAKIHINRDLRKFTTEMTENATYANYFRIFPSYTNLSRTVDTLVNPADPDQGFTTAMTDTSIADGQSGDCLVLIYKDPADDTKVSRLIGYFRVPGPNDANGNPTPGPVRRFDLPITPSSSLPIFQLIPEINDPSIYPVVVELSQDIANGKLFYNYYNRAIIVKGQILQRGGLLNSVHAQANNTYNFTVSPRG